MCPHVMFMFMMHITVKRMKSNFDFIIGMTLATKEILFAHYLDINLQSVDLTLMQKQSKGPPNCLLKIRCPVLLFF